MKKKFVFLSFHVTEQLNKTTLKKEEFINKNPVLFKTDRFLEKEFMDQIGLNAQKRPYTLVVNTAGCNKNCWFCYAYPILRKENYDKCSPIALSTQELVECFSEQLSRLKDIVNIKNRYFSKIRITGGEPLFSTSDTLLDVGELTQKEFIEKTIDYFLEFFALLDQKIGKLIKDEVIIVSEPKPYNESVSFPTWITIKEKRIDIRFDTNGFLFSDKDLGINFTERFIGGIYELFANNKLKNLRIEIDYSLKGVHPLEVYWSQRQQLPVDKEKVGEFDIENHPQYLGLKNIFELINKYNNKDSKFQNCMGITVEPGYNNVTRNYANFEGSFNWQLLKNKLKEKFGQNFRLSNVDNKMEVRGKLWMHLKRGVAIKEIYDGETFICLPEDSKEKKKELKALRARLIKENKEFTTLYIPVKIKEESQSELNIF